MARGLTVQQDFGVKSLFPRQLKSFYTRRFDRSRTLRMTRDSHSANYLNNLNRTSSKKRQSRSNKKGHVRSYPKWPFPEADKILSSDDRQCRALRHTSVGRADRRIDLFIGWHCADVESRRTRARRYGDACRNHRVPWLAAGEGNDHRTRGHLIKSDGSQ
jgi:hypothetical protein